MAEKVTVAMLKKATMRLVAALDADSSYTNSYQCQEYPELTRVVTGTKGRYPRAKAPAKSVFYVDGIEVPFDHQAIADAVNAYREARSHG